MRNCLVKVSLLIFCLLLFSCSELFRRECRVTGDYKLYACADDFENISDFKILNISELWADTCTPGLVEGSGCAFIINDTSFLKQLLIDSIFVIHESELTYWDLEHRTLVVFYHNADKGSNLYSSEFICINQTTKEVIIRSQYEISDQCAGSGIHYLRFNKLISLPKIPDDYTVHISIENVNPL